jgi:peroxisomal 2,4-dienoyl-CoA reductase
VDRLVRVKDKSKAFKRVPLGRYGTVKEIADATVYLFSDSGNFVTGQTLVGKLYRSPELATRFLPSLLLLGRTNTPSPCCIYLCWQTNPHTTVDGAAWRTSGSSPGAGFDYPDFLLSDAPVMGVKGMKKSKL